MGGRCSGSGGGGGGRREEGRGGPRRGAGLRHLSALEPGLRERSQEPAVQRRRRGLLGAIQNQEQRSGSGPGARAVPGPAGEELYRTRVETPGQRSDARASKTRSSGATRNKTSRPGQPEARGTPDAGDAAPQPVTPKSGRAESEARTRDSTEVSGIKHTQDRH
ncbi:hypothetical protein NDU88_001619 [Pleurodeles waltl]|uniref:Uncharacterized protein n=1 Tax=Pleurodeles waltl TaxID=8319 RepID=A0AAV7U6Z0_PLEWA|nr:hypothetical protein NDU88_001619 [Pleurodeles waltl]